MSLGVMIVAALMSTVIFMMGSSLSVRHYIDMNAENRRALEIVGRDLRNAVDMAEGFSPRDFELQVLQLDGSVQSVTYSYQTIGAEPSLVRATAGEREVLVRNIDELQFSFYDLHGLEVTRHPRAIKQVQLTMTTARPTRGLDRTERVVSARYILRNKHVTN
jgi:hypothetical protein